MNKKDAIFIGIGAAVVVTAAWFIRYGFGAAGEALNKYITEPLANAYVRLTAGPPVELTAAQKERKVFFPDGTSEYLTALISSGALTFPKGKDYATVAWRGTLYKVMMGSADAAGHFKAAKL